MRRLDGPDDYEFLSGRCPFIPKPKEQNHPKLKGTVKNNRWDLCQVKEYYFPLQAHHLIPKNHLPTHGVCVFLTKGYTEDDNYQLSEDTQYDTDSKNNGYCMPYATPVNEYKNASDNDKLAICKLVMDAAKCQLHQGSHRENSYADPKDATEDDNIHEEVDGYLRTVNRFLDAVQSGTAVHMNKCRICKPDENKKEIQPLAATLKHLDQASGLIKLLVDANSIFISEPAYLHWGKNRRKLKLHSG